MINQQLIDYLKERLKQKADIDVIENDLINQGWKKEDIEKTLDYINSQSNDLKENKRIIYALLIILVVFAAEIFILGFVYYKSKSSGSGIVSNTNSTNNENWHFSLPQTLLAQNYSATSNSSMGVKSSLKILFGPQSISADTAYGLFDQKFLSGSVVLYVDDGVVENGEYTGYHRIAAIASSADPLCDLGNDSYIFATKDYKTYILDTSTTKCSYTQGDLFSNKVVGEAYIPDNFPSEIDEGNFKLVRDIIYWDAPAIDNANAELKSIDGRIDWNATMSEKLTSNISNLSFFTEVLLKNAIPSSDTQDQKDSIAVQNAYEYAAANVLVEDQYGLTFNYKLEPKEGLTYTSGGELYAGSQPPNVFYTSSEFNSGSQTYKSYSGFDDQTDNIYVLQNISNSDLKPLASTKNGTQLYTLENSDSPLNQFVYYSKIVDPLNSEPDPLLLNADGYALSTPSLKQYVSKNPILIFKDSWGRWIGLVEDEVAVISDVPVVKPVIYLYPTKPTDVAVRFLNKIKLTLDIPTYENKWNVMAYPDGELKDLQPQYTDCGKIDSSVLGSEYAKSACKQEVYPYLYWAGDVSGEYPSTGNEGWIVSKNDLQNFFNDKLTYIGLNAQERSDFINYWVPELLSKNAPYYRLSFFQTEQMNKFVPIEITPAPDTLIRVFLDWSALNSLPQTPLQPQILNPTIRKGFTAVEWGGAKD